MKVRDEDLRLRSVSSLNETSNSVKAGSSSKVRNSNSESLVTSSKSGVHTLLSKLLSSCRNLDVSSDAITLFIASLGFLFSFMAFILVAFR